MKAEDIFFEDRNMPRFSRLLEDGDVEMLGITPQNDGIECMIHIGFGYNSYNGDGWFELNLTRDGEWWLSIDDSRAAKKDQLISLFKTKFFNDLKTYYTKTLADLQKNPTKGNFTWIESGTGNKIENGTFEDYKEDYDNANKAFAEPEKHIDLGIMKENEQLSEHDPDDPDYGQYYDDDGPSEDEMDDAQEEVELWIDDNIETICKNAKIEVPADLSEIDDWPDEDEWRAQAYFDSQKEFGKEWLDAMNVSIDSACDKVLYDFRKILKKPAVGQVKECDGGGAVGGDAGGAGGVASGVSSGTSTTDVIGTFDPEKGVLGPGNFIFPTRVGKVTSRLAGNGGGSKRKKDKNGKDKKYYPEKGMKVITSYDNLHEDMIEEALKSKKIEVKNNIIHCKKTEKVKLDTKQPMKKIQVKASNAIKTSKIKQLKVSTKEMKASKDTGKIATLQLDNEAKDLNIGDIVAISKNKHYKVISKRFIKDISECPCIEELSNNEMRKIGEAETKAIIFLVPIGTTK